MTPFGIVAEFLPSVVPARFMSRKIGDHCRKRSSECSHIGSYGTTAGSGRFRGGFLGKFGQCHVDKAFAARLGVFKDIFDHFFAGIEFLEVVETHRLYCDVYDGFFGDAGRALLFGEEITSGIDQTAFRDETYDLCAGHTYTTF